MALLRAKLGVSLFRHPCRKPLPHGKGCVCLVGFASLQSLWAYTPGIRAGAECGAAALTKQGRLQSVAHSRCTTQRHQRLTTRIGATPQTPFLKIMLVFRQTDSPAMKQGCVLQRFFYLVSFTRQSIFQIFLCILHGHRLCIKIALRRVTSAVFEELCLICGFNTLRNKPQTYVL